MTKIVAKFGDNRSCCSRGITDLIFHVILQDHMIKGSCDYGRKLLIAYPQPVMFSSHRHCDS